MAAEFVRVKHPDVEQEAVLPVSALRFFDGWKPVEKKTSTPKKTAAAEKAADS